MTLFVLGSRPFLIQLQINTHVDKAIAKAILQKGTRGSFHHWAQDDYELAVTMLQKPHALGGFGLTPNVLAQIAVKVAMASRFLKLVGSLPPEEQPLNNFGSRIKQLRTLTLGMPRIC